MFILHLFYTLFYLIYRIHIVRYHILVQIGSNPGWIEIRFTHVSVLRANSLIIGFNDLTSLTKLSSTVFDEPLTGSFLLC